MKKAIFSFMVIVVFCMFGLAFAQEAPQKADEPSPQKTEEPTPQEAEEPSPQEAEEPSQQKAVEPTPQQADEPTPQESDEPRPQDAGEPSPQDADESSPQEAEEPVEVIKVIDVKPFYYCALEMTGSYDQHGTGFNTLYEQTGIQNLPQSEVPIGIYLNDPNQTPEEELKWDLALALPDSSQVAEPLKLKKWEFKQVASTMYDGVFGAEEMGQVYGEIYAWIGQNKYVPAGPLVEKYLSQPEQNADGEWVGKVEIWIPVQKTQ